MSISRRPPFITIKGVFCLRFQVVWYNYMNTNTNINNFGVAGATGLQFGMLRGCICNYFWICLYLSVCLCMSAFFS